MPFLALQKERERVISSLGENELQASLDSSALLLLGSITILSEQDFVGGNSPDAPWLGSLFSWNTIS